METFNVISLDVWGNEEDGFEVNDAHTTGRTVDLPVDCYDKAAILQALYDAGEITQTDGGDCEICESNIYITEKATGRPVLELRKPYDC